MLNKTILDNIVRNFNFDEFKIKFLKELKKLSEIDIEIKPSFEYNGVADTHIDIFDGNGELVTRTDIDYDYFDNEHSYAIRCVENKFMTKYINKHYTFSEIVKSLDNEGIDTKYLTNKVNDYYNNTNLLIYYHGSLISKLDLYEKLDMDQLIRRLKTLIKNTEDKYIKYLNFVTKLDNTTNIHSISFITDRVVFIDKRSTTCHSFDDYDLNKVNKIINCIEYIQSNTYD